MHVALGVKLVQAPDGPQLAVRVSSPLTSVETSRACSLLTAYKLVDIAASIENTYPPAMPIPRRVQIGEEVSPSSPLVAP